MHSGLEIAMVAACPFPASFASSGLIRELSLALSKKGHRIHVVTYHLGDSNFDVGDLIIHRIPPISLYKKRTSGISMGKPFLDMLLVAKLVRVLNKYPIQIIHAHNYEAPIAAYIARKIRRVPVIYHAHNTMYHELPTYFKRPFAKHFADRIGKILDRSIPKRADHIIAVSTQLQHHLRALQIPDEKITLLSPSIYSDCFENSNSSVIRKRLGLKREPIIIYTGGLQPYQNCSILIPLLRHVIKEIPDIHLLILARSEPESLQNLAAEAGIHDRIHFLLGSGLDFERDCLSAANIAVIPRQYCIGFPVKILNYFAARKPVVCFEGLIDEFHHGVELMKVPSNDVKSMGAAVIELIREPKKAETLALNGYQAVSKRHRWDNAVNTVEDIYFRYLS